MDGQNRSVLLNKLTFTIFESTSIYAEKSANICWRTIKRWGLANQQFKAKIDTMKGALNTLKAIC